MVTLRDIAERTGVSTSTASIVVNRRTVPGVTIGEETRRRVEEAAIEMGYRPNLAARSLSTRTTNIIGVWTQHLASSYSAAVLTAVQKLLQAEGYAMLVSVLSQPVKWEEVAAAHWPVAGVLAHNVNATAEDFVRTFGPRHPPLVVFGVDGFQTEILDSVGIDLSIGAREVLAHLRAQGCRRIALFAPITVMTPGNQRYDEYCAAMKQSGQEPIFISCPWEEEIREPAEVAMRAYLQTCALPDAIFCFNDDTALAVYRALCDLKIRVPEDVALVGCDGIADTRYLETPLSTIAVQYEAMCGEAWRLLQRRIASPKATPEQVLLPAHLEIRASSQRGSTDA